MAVEIELKKPSIMLDRDGVYRVGATRVRFETVVDSYLDHAHPIWAMLHPSARTNEYDNIEDTEVNRLPYAL